MSASPHIDYQILSTLRDVMGDDYALLITTFRTDSQTRLGALAQAILLPDAESVRRAAHSLKGSSSNIGAARLADYCSVMESLALAGDPTPWPVQLDAIKREFETVSALLE